MSYIRQAAGVFDARKGTPNEAYSVSAVLLNLRFQGTGGNNPYVPQGYWQLAGR